MIEMEGRLGNQMFIYAFYKEMCKRFPDINFKVDISTVYQKKYERGLELTYVFPGLDIEFASALETYSIEKKLTFKYRGKGSRILRNITDGINAKRRKKIESSIVTDKSLSGGDLSEISREKIESIRFFSGFWQKVSYYKDSILDLQQDFKFREMTDSYDIELAQRIANTNSVSVHIRRGDYVGEVLDILDADYYKRIVSEILKENPDTTLFFFSDDIEYINEHFGDIDKIIVSANRDDFSNFRDLQLMSMCRTNVIANSTFSLWAALLNNNPDKRVYYPSKFTKDEEAQMIELPGFIRVDV